MSNAHVEASKYQARVSVPLSAKIDICIATYKRPADLLRLLNSLAAQATAEKFRIIVVDNDAKQSAAPIVDEFRRSADCPVLYDVEARQGISYARNRCLQHVTAEYLAFLDDDEFVRETWLESMLSLVRDDTADVTFGPVIGVLPSEAPVWARTHPCFKPKRMASGTPVPHGGSGNVLLRTRALGSPPREFNPAFGLTGGGDTEFFLGLGRGGARMVWCDSAEAFECVPKNRISLGWVCRRGFRCGQAYYRIFLIDALPLARVSWFAKKVAQLVVGTFLLLPLAILGRTILFPHISRLCSAVGQLSSLFGDRFVYREYAPTLYRQDDAA